MISRLRSVGITTQNLSGRPDRTALPGLAVLVANPTTSSGRPPGTEQPGIESDAAPACARVFFFPRSSRALASQRCTRSPGNLRQRCSRDDCGRKRGQLSLHVRSIREQPGAQPVGDPDQACPIARSRQETRGESQLLELRKPQDARLRPGASEAIAILVRKNNRP